MGLLDFVKEAGERLFGKDEEPREDRNEAMEAAIRRRIARAGLKAAGLEVAFNEGVVTLRGEADDHEMGEKIVLAVGNSDGVTRVDDLLKVSARAPQMAGAAVAAASADEDQPAEATESVLCSVQRGDTLSAVAREHYGNAGGYMVIFEANKPLLQDPDRIYPGQVLRIPPIRK